MRVPVKNLKSYDVIYRIPEPLLISNIDDTTSSQTCSCVQNTDIVVSWEETNILKNNLTSERIFINNETMSQKNSQAMEWISLMPNKRDVYITPRGKDGLVKGFQKSNQVNGNSPTTNRGTMILKNIN